MRAPRRRLWPGRGPVLPRRIAVVRAWARSPRYHRGGAIRSFTCLLGRVSVMLVGSSPIGAQETPVSAAPDESLECLEPEFLSNALIECAGSPAGPGVEPAVTDGIVSEIDASSATASTATPASEAIVFPPYCRVRVDVIFWAAASGSSSPRRSRATTRRAPSTTSRFGPKMSIGRC
jgi:hypothetical protein